MNGRLGGCAAYAIVSVAPWNSLNMGSSLHPPDTTLTHDQVENARGVKTSTLEVDKTRLFDPGTRYILYSADERARRSGWLLHSRPTLGFFPRITYVGTIESGSPCR